ITASHNPRGDNGYKLYLGDGAQILPEAAAQLERAAARLGPLPQIPAGPLDGPLVARHGDEIARAYLDAVVAASPGPPAAAGPGAAGPGAAGQQPPLLVVYTPLHGVAGSLAARAIERAGYPPPRL